MYKATAALGCFLMTGAIFAQQTPSTASSPAKAPAAGQASTAPASTAPAHPLTDVQAHEMLKITGADKIKPQLTEGLTSYFHNSLPFAPKDVTDDLDQSLAKLDVEAQVIAIYKQHISTEEAESIIAFYKTPAGKHMIDALPEILQQSQQTGMQLARKTAQDVVTRHRPEIEAAAKQYQAEHAPKPGPSLNTPSPDTPPAPSTPPQAAKPQPQ
jgi:uncharacterized protein